MTDITDENVKLQAEFNAAAIARLNDPMVTDEPRDSSTLDSGVLFDGIGFDEAPGSYEDDVLRRLEDMESKIDVIVELNERTHTAMENIVNVLESITHQVEPTIKLIVESKLFRMFVPASKAVKGVKE